MGLQLPKRARRVGMYAVLTASTLLLGACSSQDKAQIRRLAQPQDVTDRSGVMHSLWMWAWLAAILTGILVWGLIGYACIKFRRRHDDEVPVQTRYNLPIEILYTIAPVVMVVVFFFFTVQAQDKVLAQTAHPDHTVDVVGQQWSWTFNYVQDKALDGQTSVYDAGTTAYRPTLVLPVNETVRFNLSSPDVIHSFWVPAFLMKMDVVPGRDNHFDLTPTREGTYVGRCAELCGTYHSRMLFNVKVVSADQFATYLKQLQAKGQTGLALGGSDATTEKGLTNAQNGAGQ
ncbi:MAG: aa3-type cytochrome oxidase subunit II [Actinomycetes bacterium]